MEEKKWLFEYLLRSQNESQTKAGRALCKICKNTGFL